MAFKNQTELHRHLDISLRPKTFYELALEHGVVSQSTSFESFVQKYVLRTPMKDLSTVIKMFEIYPKVQTRPEILERIAYETVEDAFNEGTRQIELRFSPSFVSEGGGLEWPTILDSYETGIRKAEGKFKGIRAGLICIATREMGIDAVQKTVEFYIENSERFIAVDLAGDEVDYPCRMFKEAFADVKALSEKSQANITIHSGEASGPENVWEAIELLGAQRIGHGIRSIEDDSLLRYLVKNQICLEVCPTSNWLTQSVKSLETHPLPNLIEKSVPCSINTDDPTPFGTTLTQEINVCRTQLKLTDAQIQKCFDDASEATFL